MSNFTSDLQGMFTATGNTINLSIRSGVDRMSVYNLTQGAANQTTAVGVKYYWQNGMATGAKWTTFKSNAAAAANLEQYITSAGFFLVDSSQSNNSPVNATITAISTATPPVVTNTGTNGLSAGSVVKLINVAGAQQLGGMDFTVGYGTLSATTFSLDFMPAIAAGTTGSWKLIPYDPVFYPSRRSITAITSNANGTTTIELSVTHEYEVGQAIRVIVPAAFGMTQINGMVGNILSVVQTTTTNTITVDINSSGFTAFAFPLTTAVPFSPAETVPVGENTAVAIAAGVPYATDATINQTFLGIALTGGVNCPGGATSDVMMWHSSTTDLNDLSGNLVITQ